MPNNMQIHHETLLGDLSELDELFCFSAKIEVEDIVNIQDCLLIWAYFLIMNFALHSHEYDKNYNNRMKKGKEKNTRKLKWLHARK